MKRCIARVVQMLPADGHQPWLGVDAKARHQKTTKGMQSFTLSAIGARRLKSFVHWKLTLSSARSCGGAALAHGKRRRENGSSQSGLAASQLEEQYEPPRQPSRQQRHQHQ